MNSIQKKFEILGLPNRDNESYTNANSYSKRYKKCTVLNHGNVTYSTNTKAASSKDSCYKPELLTAHTS